MSLNSKLRVDLPSWFRRADAVRYWGRDAKSLQERAEAERMRWALTTPWGSSLGIELHFESADSAQVRLLAVSEGGDGRDATWAASTLRRLLGLHLEPAGFEEELRGGPHERLIAGRLGLSVPQTATVFDGALWVICGQQVSLPVAFSLRRRLAERYGRPLGDLFAPPRPADIASLEERDLVALGLSRRKAEYLHGLCRLIGDGFDLEALRSEPAAEVEQRLLAVRGFGPWSVNYLMMRSLGFADCVPVGDAGLARALVRYFELEKRPDAERTRDLMRVFAPYRSLATFHMWASFAG